MNGLHADGCRTAMVTAKEEFEVEMKRLKDRLVQAKSAEEEAAIEQQMRECEVRHRDMLASLQRSVY